MARLILPMLALLLLAGCSAPQPGPVELGSVDREEPTRQREPEAAPDCKTLQFDGGTSFILRIRCEGGTGTATAKLTGCSDTSEQSSWLTLATKEGRLAHGNATATVAQGESTLASLAVDAHEDEGKETILPAATYYSLSLELSAWRGEWVEATVECPTV